MVKKLQLFLVISLFICQLDAQVHEIQKIKEVFNFLKPNCKQIVVFDIDNTLLCPKTHLGSDQWVSNLVKHQTVMGLDQNSAWKKVLPLYFHLSKYIDLLPTEADLPVTVKSIEQACSHTICLTARSPLNLLEITLKQLANNNLSFRVPEIDHSQLVLPEQSYYQDGVLFCGINCKGQVLIQFLAACHYVPDEIILIDDKLYNLQAVAKELSALSINFVGLRYAGCDEHINNFNFQQTELELAEFLINHPLECELASV